MFYGDSKEGRVERVRRVRILSKKLEKFLLRKCYWIE